MGGTAGTTCCVILMHMCDRMIGGMLWCKDVYLSLTRAHPHESGSIRECMCDDDHVQGS